MKMARSQNRIDGRPLDKGVHYLDRRKAEHTEKRRQTRLKKEAESQNLHSHQDPSHKSEDCSLDKTHQQLS